MKSKETFPVAGMTSNTTNSTTNTTTNTGSDNAMDKIYLRKGEVLSVHMDCLNQFGQLITLDDIHDVHGVVSRVCI